MFVLEIRLGVFAIQFALSGLEKMDFTQLLSNTQSDLKSLKKNLKGFDEESEKFCKFLSSKYDQVASWIIKKTSLENPQSLDKDELGQTLIPDDIILGEETRFLACKATGDGDCLFNSASRIVVGNESLCHLLRLLTILELYSYSNFYAKHPAFQEYLNAGVANGYDEDTLFTLCLTALGAATWDGKDRISAIKAEAEGSSKEKVWCGMFHFMALASVLGRPLYSVYPNAGSRVREFFHRKPDTPAQFRPGSTRYGIHHVVTRWGSGFSSWDLVPTQSFYSYFQGPSSYKFEFSNSSRISARK